MVPSASPSKRASLALFQPTLIPITKNGRDIRMAKAKNNEGTFLIASRLFRRMSSGEALMRSLNGWVSENCDLAFGSSMTPLLWKNWNQKSIILLKLYKELLWCPTLASCKDSGFLLVCYNEAMNKTNNKQGGFLPIFLIVAVLLVAGGGYWYKESNKEKIRISEEADANPTVEESVKTEVSVPVLPQSDTIKPQISVKTGTVTNSTPTTKIEEVGTPSAQAAYLRISAEFDAVKTYADLEAY